ncbi:MAG: Fe-S cluster assembly ATPase SufC [Elusimicrobiota bacterium]
MPLLEIRDLWVKVENKEILRGLNLVVNAGESHALMGPNGSGKSTLAFVLAGHPKYTVTKGQIFLDGMDLLAIKPHERARLGVFLAFQYPVAIAGVTVSTLLRNALKAMGREEELKNFRRAVKERLADLKIDESFMSRSVNEGFSGGEKKRLEMLQLAVLKPRLAILDETDSGLDIDALKTVAADIDRYVKNSSVGVILITHYQRLLNFIRPYRIHILVEGRLAASGGWEIVERLEKEGYEPFAASGASVTR